MCVKNGACRAGPEHRPLEHFSGGKALIYQGVSRSACSTFRWRWSSSPCEASRLLLVETAGRSASEVITPRLAEAKPGNKPQRDKLRGQMLAQGCNLAQIAEEMGRRWRLRPRQAWRYAHELTQEEVAARCTMIAGDPEATITGKRISDYELWPHGGIRPSPSVLALLGRTYGVSPEHLLDVFDRECLRPDELAAIRYLAASSAGEPERAALQGPETRIVSPRRENIRHISLIRRSSESKGDLLKEAIIMAARSPATMPVG
jgi:transcriptional regulator with XRE-family HTH domain